MKKIIIKAGLWLIKATKALISFWLFVAACTLFILVIPACSRLFPSAEQEMAKNILSWTDTQEKEFNSCMKRNALITDYLLEDPIYEMRRYCSNLVSTAESPRFRINSLHKIKILVNMSSTQQQAFMDCVKRKQQTGIDAHVTMRKIKIGEVCLKNVEREALEMEIGLDHDSQRTTKNE